ncbi:MAG TPA: energy transducer TonB [Pedobacter sp.]|jgi:protein TonB
MFNPKSTIYQTGWLDLVFANRNKSYGAYELRQHADERLLRSLIITLFFVGVIVGYSFLQKKAISDGGSIAKPEPLDTTIIVLKSLPQVSQPPAPAAQSPSNPSRSTQRNRSTVPVVVSTNVIDDLPTTSILNTSDAPQISDGFAIGGSGTPGGTDPAGGNTAGAGGTENTTVYTTGSIELFPEFPGGMEAFSKFLRKNLRYPPQAQEAEVSGKVFVTFIVEKDGRLTDIKIARSIGHGCDEEAERVLRKSPQWKPGIQNGTPVRVLFTLPLSFTLRN